MIAVSDPSRLMVLDEIAGLLGHRIMARVATLSQITDLLKKTEQSQRVLDEASEGLTFDVLSGDENADENISIEKLTSEEDISPIIRLVDTTIFTALERRASDIHIETNDDSVIVKYRIDGVLQMAMAPIAREHHSTILSRIKIMSELDIAERRVPQDGRFRVRYKGRLIDFRVSIMPTVHGENAVLRVLDKESMSEKFNNLTLDVVGFADEDLSVFAATFASPTAWCWSPGPPVPAKPPPSTPRSTRSRATKTRSSPSRIRSSTRFAASPRFRSTRKRASPSPADCAPSCATTPTRSWSAKSATRRRRRLPSTPRSPATWCSPPSTPTTWWTCWAASSTWAWRPITSYPPSIAFWRSAWSAPSASTAPAPSTTTTTRSRRRPGSRRVARLRLPRGRGCMECGGTGYRGRTAIHELLDLTDPIRELILEKKPTSEVRKLAQKEGMSFLRESALDRVRRGLTTLKEINKVTFIEASR